MADTPMEKMMSQKHAVMDLLVGGAAYLVAPIVLSGLRNTGVLPTADLNKNMDTVMKVVVVSSVLIARVVVMLAAHLTNLHPDKFWSCAASYGVLALLLWKYVGLEKMEMGVYVAVVFVVALAAWKLKWLVMG